MKIIFNERIQDNEKSRILSKYGLTNKTLYNLSFDTYFSEEEIEYTKKCGAKINENPAAWVQECQKTHLQTAKTIYEIMEILHKNFRVGQYRRSSYYEKYDLWFWCNSEGINHTTPTHTVGNKHYDLSYVTLSFDQKENAEKILELLQNLELPDDFRPVQCTILYMLEFMTEQVIEVCQLFAKTEIMLSIKEKSQKDTFYKLGSHEIRLFYDKNDYAYRYKHSQTFYRLRNDVIIDILIENNLLEKYVKLYKGEKQ